MRDIIDIPRRRQDDGAASRTLAESPCWRVYLLAAIPSRSIVATCPVQNAVFAFISAPENVGAARMPRRRKGRKVGVHGLLTLQRRGTSCSTISSSR